jgi:hypothetical protein
VFIACVDGLKGFPEAIQDFRHDERVRRRLEDERFAEISEIDGDVIGQVRGKFRETGFKQRRLGRVSHILERVFGGEEGEQHAFRELHGRQLPADCV